ncbi:hypothetical protein SAMN05216236_13939 [Sedimentitalea nanhaiensis]|uniref:Uncharacterized protein n=1 Tax=Sedimentitalea nanhaiensis TaxID=999627 RepID=A0A1I7E0C1_9RHOB|nr:hypothetical protein SAMN05216236_13939 [Sedimentitalea nanhaiensis]
MTQAVPVGLYPNHIKRLIMFFSHGSCSYLILRRTTDKIVILSRQPKSQGNGTLLIQTLRQDFLRKADRRRAAGRARADCCPFAIHHPQAGGALRASGASGRKERRGNCHSRRERGSQTQRASLRAFHPGLARGSNARSTRGIGERVLRNSHEGRRGVCRRDPRHDWQRHYQSPRACRRFRCSSEDRRTRTTTQHPWDGKEEGRRDDSSPVGNDSQQDDGWLGIRL